MSIYALAEIICFHISVQLTFLSEIVCLYLKNRLFGLNCGLCTSISTGRWQKVAVYTLCIAHLVTFFNVIADWELLIWRVWIRFPWASCHSAHCIIMSYWHLGVAHWKKCLIIWPLINISRECSYLDVQMFVEACICFAQNLVHVLIAVLCTKLAAICMNITNNY